MARRILALFLGGAFLPIVVLTLISHGVVTNQLQEQSWERLRQTSKILGLNIMGRLDVLDAALRSVSAWLSEEPDPGAAVREAEDRVPVGLGNLVVRRLDGRPLAGRTDPSIPPLTPEQEEHLRSDLALVVRLETDPPTMLLGAPLDAQDLTRGILWAELDPGYLLASEGGNPAGLGAKEPCVFDHVGEPWLCSSEVAPTLTKEIQQRLLKREGEAARFVWRDGSRKYLAGYWSIFLQYQYGLPSWTVVISESEEVVLADVRTFRLMFILMLLLAFALVFFLANILIRRSLGPIQALKEATQRIARGEFDARVELQTRDEFGQLASAFNRMTHRLGSQFGTLRAMGRFDRAVLDAPSSAGVAEAAVRCLSGLFSCEGVSLTLVPMDLGQAASTVSSSQGAGPSTTDGVHLTSEELDELRRSPLHVMKGADSTRSYLQLEAFSARGIRNFLVLPVLLGEDVGAVIALGYAVDPPTDRGDLRQAIQFAGQVAIGLKSARLMESLNQLSWGALLALGRSMDAKSEWTAGHTERVTTLALSLGRRMTLSDRQLEVLRQGALVHDIGKVGVPGSVLDKPGKLEEEEIQAIRAHPRIGAKILAPIAPFTDAIPIVLHHHERYDGGGYPDGLAGEEIPLLARVLAVVDVYDALVSARPYRGAWSHERALEFIEEGAGSQFDPEIVAAFLEMVSDSGAGLQKEGETFAAATG